LAAKNVAQTLSVSTALACKKFRIRADMSIVVMMTTVAAGRIRRARRV
jgi:hypothetical protein